MNSLHRAIAVAKTDEAFFVLFVNATTTFNSVFPSSLFCAVFSWFPQNAMWTRGLWLLFIDGCWWFSGIFSRANPKTVEK